MSNPIEAIALKFIENLLAKNPRFLSDFVVKRLTDKGVDPAIVSGVGEAIVELVPFLLAEIN